MTTPSPIPFQEAFIGAVIERIEHEDEGLAIYFEGGKLIRVTGEVRHIDGDTVAGIAVQTIVLGE